MKGLAELDYVAVELGGSRSRYQKEMFNKELSSS